MDAAHAGAAHQNGSSSRWPLSPVAHSFRLVGWLYRRQRIVRHHMANHRRANSTLVSRHEHDHAMGIAVGTHTADDTDIGWLVDLVHSPP